MDLSRIDYWAATGKSVMHRAPALSKAAATAAAIATVIIAGDIALVFSLYVFLLLSVRIARLPLLRVLGISVLPGFFAILFAFSLARGGWHAPALVIMRALTAATAMIVLIATTPYFEVIGLFGRALPAVVRDGLFMTYRSFFILFDLFDRFLVALKLRGGYQPRRLAANAGNTASGVGMLFIRAYDKSQRLYDVMNIRGYSGMLSAANAGGFGATGIPYLATSFLFLAVAVISRISSGVNPGLRLLAVPLLYYVCMEAAGRWKR